MSREEWQAVRSLTDDRSIVIKKADKESCVVVWGRNDYLSEAERQFSGTKVYRDVSNTENILSKILETSNIMQKGWSYNKDSGDFTNKTKNVSTIPGNAILVTADVVGLYPRIPHEAGLRALREALDKQDKKCIPTEDLVKMAEFVLKNNFFEFNSKIKQQVSGTAIGTKFAPPYACLFMD